MSVHIEGMGVLGCLLALKLRDRGIEFTWHDNDSAITAWRASTGSITPAGKPTSKDWLSYEAWEAAYSSKWLKPVKHLVEPAIYVFNHKHPPHAGRFEVAAYGSLRTAKYLPSYHLNVQQFVAAVRKLIRKQEAPPFHPGKQDRYIVAHGFNDMTTHYYWGWHARVKLGLRVATLAQHRPCFYFAQGKFVMAYAYPCPGTDLWYAGSSIIRQRVPKSLEIAPKFARWVETFERLGAGEVEVAPQALPRFYEGWRPAMEGEPEVIVNGNMIVMPPLAYNGVRHGLLYVDQVLTYL